MSVTKDMLTGRSITAAAAGSPPVAGSLGIVNLPTNSYDKVNSTVFEGATARVLSDAIRSSQQQYLSMPGDDDTDGDSDLRRHCNPSTIGIASYGQCDVFQTLEFVNGYANACSLKNGLAILEANSTASSAQRVAKATADQAKNALAESVKVQKQLDYAVKASQLTAKQDAATASQVAQEAKQSTSGLAGRLSDVDKRLKALEQPRVNTSQ